jgi:hypothetical protein
MPHTTNPTPGQPHHPGVAHPQLTPEPRPADRSWQPVLDALREAGARAGRDAADWWEQDTLGGRASGDTAARAAVILAGLDNLDPRIVDALPVCDLSGRWADAPTEADLYHAAAPEHAPGWDGLDAQSRDEAIEAYRDGFDTAVHDRVAEHCHRTIGPATPDTTGPDTTGGGVHRRVA